MGMRNSLRGSRVLITGGAGAIGSNLCDLVVQAGAREIVVIDNFVRGRRDNLTWAEANGPVTVVEGDICDRALVDELTEGIDLVFHQAAIRITQCAEEPRLAKEVMVDGTFNVLEAAVNHRVRQGRSPRRRPPSTGSPTPSRPPRQHHPYANDTIYGAAKVFNEGMLRSFHAMYGLDYVALRYFNVYGAADGHPRRLHGGARPLDGAHRRRARRR